MNVDERIAALRRAMREAPRRLRIIARLTRDPVHRRALLRGVPATVGDYQIGFGYEHATVLDVGANRGQFALFALQRFPEARVVSFEPLPGARAKLMRTVPGERLRVIGAAAGETRTTAAFHVSRRDYSSSLLPVSARQTEEFPGTGEIEQIDVDVVRLDEVLDAGDLVEPVLLKIDVQGAELATLAGAEGILPRVSEVLVECSFVALYEGQALADEVVCHLRDRDFRLAGVYSILRGEDGSCIQADLLFRRRIADA